jgi:hypothetical protein
VRAFLERFAPLSRTLVLIGPSGGYSLPRDWLSRFERVVAFEPDRIARRIFERRHRIRPDWRGKFPFGKSGVLNEVAPPDAAILFCNLLGQIEIRNPRVLGKWLRHELEGREWASFHDALSGDGIDFDTEDAGRSRAGLETMKKWIHVRNPGRGRIEVLAHDAPELFREFPGLEYRYWQWRLTPRRTFLTEGVFPAKMKTRETG